MKKYYLAIDIGASSGRHIVGWHENNRIHTEEVFRFLNGVTEHNGHLIWDIDSLFKNVVNGIAAAKAKFPNIESLSIDTWGVDYVLMRGSEEVFPVYSYRDDRTKSIIPEVHKKVPFARLYESTGCQFQPFNSIYQLYSDKLSGRFDDVTDFLMIPEYLIWKLCGKKIKEFTNATTTGIVNAVTGEFDTEIISALGLPHKLFPQLSRPGTVAGEHFGIKCVLCATHDTASAVEGVDMSANAPYISSGTWSLFGVKTPKPLTDAISQKSNWSNEGGVGYNRYQKNIMGMWIVNRLRDELCPERSFEDIVLRAQTRSFDEVVDVNSPEFFAPNSMKAAFDSALSRKVQNTDDYFCCAYRSLAASYMNALRELQHNTGQEYKEMYIVGGGAKNAFLNHLTVKATGCNVIALPIEATAIGNLKIQMEADNELQ